MDAKDINIFFCKDCNKSKKNLQWIKEWEKQGINLNLSQKALNYFTGFIGLMDSQKIKDTSICPYCSGELIGDYASILTSTEYNRDVLCAMIKLKKDDPIEYQLKLNQLKLQDSQKVEIKKQQREPINNIPRCPKCGSTAIDAVNRGFSLLSGFWGSGKTMNYCRYCGHKWKPKK